MSDRLHPAPGRIPSSRGAATAEELQRTYMRWPGILMLAAGIVIAPLVALINEEVAYVVVPWACHRGAPLLIRIVPAISLVVVVVLGLVSLRDWRRAGRGTHTDDATLADRTRFIALAGIGLSGLSALMILWSWIATWMLSPCARS